MTPGTRQAGPALLATALAALVVLASCAGDVPADGAPSLDRETFIATYVDLRTEAVRTGAAELATEARIAVLERHGVSEEDLLGFVEAHGEDVDFMRAVWDEVEARLDAARIQTAPEGPR